MVILLLTSLLVLDSLYLSAVTFFQWLTGTLLEDLLYQYVFLVHLVLGVLLIGPTLFFIGFHLKRAIGRPNKLAVGLGLSLAVSIVLLFITGIALTRGLPVFELKDSEIRQIVYWAHVILPLLVIWIFVLHRLVGPKIRWKAGVSVGVLSAAFSVLGVAVLTYQSGSEVVEPISFEPSLARLNAPELIDPAVFATDEYCAECHSDIHQQWQVSAHKWASFNNPAYAFTVAETREKVLERDGHVEAARFCAGCHDPIPLFSGLFDDPDFDFVNHWTGQAGITCLSCHAIIEVDSVRGNAAFTIEPPDHYPFSMRNDELLDWINGLLIKGKPNFHKKTFLKPFHESAEFCSTCHKVHLPEDLNHYKWLRGQNHYDSFLLSGFSGHSITSFYYPPQAIENCNECHMPAFVSGDFGSKYSEELQTLAGSHHQFPAANTALQHLLDLPPESLQPHEDILKDSVIVDIFGVREGKSIEGELQAPIGPLLPTINAGKAYVFDVVLRSVSVGHKFTEGTADSNEVWMDITVKNNGKTIGRSGGIRQADGNVDHWSHFVNAYVIDRNGNRIDRRNAEDIFVKLYDNQIGPGSATVVHYAIELPEDLTGSIEIETKLNYRKFDTTYMKAIQGEHFRNNDLPITVISSDSVVLPIDQIDDPTLESTQRRKAPSRPKWLRWNDYGIGFLNKPKRGALRQAEHAFLEVSELGRGEGNINLARVYIEEGRLDEAIEQLGVAEQRKGYPWSITWFSGVIDLQNGYLDEAIAKFRTIEATQFNEAVARGFDFSRDYRLLNKLALAYFDRSKIAVTPEEEQDWLRLARDSYLDTLSIDPENTTAHYGLWQVFERLGQTEEAEYHQSQHETYRIDDNARDRAIYIARQNDPAANHASEPIVIYDLQRNGAYELDANP